MASEEGPRAFVRAYQITSRAVSASIGMVVPGLLGWWVDTRLGWLPVLTTLGFAVGLAYGIWRLAKLQVGDRGRAASEQRKTSETSEPN